MTTPALPRRPLPVGCKTYDPVCQECAEHFLSDEVYTADTAELHEARVKSLAGVIQEAVEDWFASVGNGESLNKHIVRPE